DGKVVEAALASSSVWPSFQRKVSRPEIADFLGLIPHERRILSDDPRMRNANGKKRPGKPAPDIFLTTLDVINASRPADDKILPKECLVFEDSVPGTEAARRAGMRVVWVPHPELAVEWAGRDHEVLAGRTNLLPIGDEHLLGELGDGWGEKIDSLEAFNYAKYDIEVRERN
ncbi:hypothetical protein QBC35DRAFT_392789, partial [Podospora australis]